MRKPLFGLLALWVSIIVFLAPAFAQETEGRLSFGVYGGANLWINDLRRIKPGAAAQLAVRYGLSPVVSLGVIGGYEELKSENEGSATTGSPYSYMKAHAFPLALVAYLHFLPQKQISPYMYAGAGFFLYKRTGAGGVPIPDARWYKSFILPYGVGVQAFLTSHYSLCAEAGYAFIDDGTDLLRVGASPDGFVVGKIGIQWYPGSSESDDDDADGLTNGQERRYGSDAANPDTDNDGLTDYDEVMKYHTSPIRQDTDADGLPDGDELTRYQTDPTKYDTDGDGLSDGEEILKYLTSPTRVDSDGDGLSDGDEVLRYRTDPLKVDTDGDGLSDWDELKTYRTDPTNADTDGDGIIDGEEVHKYKTDPTKADTDGGGLIDGAEIIRGTDPLNRRDDMSKEGLVLQPGGTTILEGVTFQPGSAIFTELSESILQRVYNVLVAQPELRVEIAGYTDNVGTRTSNLLLSQRRAEAVRVWLVGRGIAPERLNARGYGSNSPIETNTTPEGRARNRRIELHVK